MIPLLIAEVQAAGRNSIEYRIGSALPALIALLITLWCVSRLSKPGMNKKGPAALLLLFGGLTIALGLSLLRTESKLPSLVGAVLLSMTALLSVAMAIAALVDDAPFTAGRGPAITALILSGLTVLGLMFAAVMGFVKASTEGRQPRTGTESTGAPVERPQERYRLRSLPRPWVETGAKKLNELASLGILRTRPEVYFIVIAEKVEAGTTIELDAYTAAVKSNFLNGSPDGKFLSESPETIQGKPGVRLIATRKLEGKDVFYRYWLHVGDGMAYQAISWMLGKESGPLVVQSEPIFSALEILPRPE